MSNSINTTRTTIKQRFSIIGNAPKLNTAIDIAAQVAATEVTVLVIGENGTGKDVFSKIIHQFGKRKHKQLISINCGAIPEGTIDSELFGHEKGSFTSAYDSRKGYFEEADGGVIFLDEIAETPLSTQARLLRILENGEYLRVGSSKVQKTDVRVVAATNRNLLDAIRANKFREDLYFRLNTVTINVPPLRDRGEDIELLFRYFSNEFGARYGRPSIQLKSDAASMLYEYHWPGNVRELRNFVEKLTVLTTSPEITGDIISEHLPLYSGQQLVITNPFQQKSNQNPEHSSYEQSTSSFFQNGYNPQLGKIENDVILQALFELKKDLSDMKALIATLLQHQIQANNVGGVMSAPLNQAIHPNTGTTTGLTSTVANANYSNYPIQPFYSKNIPLQEKASSQTVEISVDEPENESFSLDNNEKVLIIKSLNKHKNNRKKAAMELGVSERTLYRKIRAYGLE